MNCQAMTTNCLSENDGEIGLLRHYHFALLFGAGTLLSLMLSGGFCSMMWMDIRDYLSQSRTAYLETRESITQEIVKVEDDIRRDVIYAELLWKSVLEGMPGGNAQSERRPANGDVPAVMDVMQWPIAISSTARPVFWRPRAMVVPETLISMSRDDAQTTESLYMGHLFDNADNVTWFDSRVLIDRGPNQLQSGWISSSAQSKLAYAGSVVKSSSLFLPAANGAIFWRKLNHELLTGNGHWQLIGPAFFGTRLVSLFSRNFHSEKLSAVMAKAGHDGNLAIVDSAGRLLSSSWAGEVLDPDLTRNAMYSGIWKERGDSSEYVYRKGMLVLSFPLANTGWTIFHAHSWKTIAHARGSYLITCASLLLLLLSLLWALIYVLNKKILSPLFLRARDAFDSEQHNRLIIEEAPCGLCLISRSDGQVLLKNRVMRIYDLGESTLVEQFRNLHRERRSNDLGSEDLSRGDPPEVGEVHEMSVDTAAYGRRDLLVRMVDARYRDEDLVLFSFSDISVNKQMENELHRACSRAEMENREKSQYLAIVSHEIKNPLSGILGHIELLSHTPMSSSQRDRVQTISSASLGLQSIINDTLDLAKIESGHMKLEHICFDILEVFEHTITMLWPVAHKKGLPLFYRFCPDTPRWLVGDPTRLRQVIVNLLSNAIKFTDQGYVCIALSAENEGSGSLSHLVLRIVDTGTGIAESRKLEVFQPFVQGDLSIARQYGGSGLGLSLCRQLTEMMQGSIAVNSQLGTGSEFVVRLPLERGLVDQVPINDLTCGEIGLLCDVEEWRAHVLEHLQAWGVGVKVLRSLHEWSRDDGIILLFGSKKACSAEQIDSLLSRGVSLVDATEEGPRRPAFCGKRTACSCYSIDGLRCALKMAFEKKSVCEDSSLSFNHEPSSNKGVRVLVVEDHAISRELIGDQLALLGYCVSLADSAAQALQLYIGDQYDIVLTDLSMPKIDGYMLARMLRAQGATLPIVALTANTVQAELRSCRDAGIDAVITKPMSLRDIDCVVQRHLGLSAVSSAESPALRQLIPRSNRILNELRDGSERALASLRLAHAKQQRDIVLLTLHELKGAFAMQKQREVVSACHELEQDCCVGIADDFLLRLDDLESLILRALNEIELALP